MTNICKQYLGQNICERLGVKLSPGKYKLGFRFCRICNRAFLTEKYKCPCCGSGLRTKPKVKR